MIVLSIEAFQSRELIFQTCTLISMESTYASHLATQIYRCITFTRFFSSGTTPTFAIYPTPVTLEKVTQHGLNQRKQQ